VFGSSQQDEPRLEISIQYQSIKYPKDQKLHALQSNRTSFVLYPQLLDSEKKLDLLLAEVLLGKQVLREIRLGLCLMPFFVS